MKRFHFAAALGALLCASSLASAQLVVGGTSTVGVLSPAYYVDLTTNPGNPVAYALWPNAANKRTHGLAADDANGRMFNLNAARLNVWTYGQRGVSPTFIAGLYRQNGAGTITEASGFDDIAIANGGLYGWCDFASSNFTRGIYRIPETLDAQNRLITIPVWLDTNTSANAYNFEGITYSSTTGKFFALNNGLGGASPGQPTGIYTIDAFGGGAVTKIAELPSLYASWDGLALGGGKLWLTTHDKVNQQLLLANYDLGTQTYGAEVLGLPYADTVQRATGATWTTVGREAFVPEPAAAGLLFAGLPALARRRNRR